MTAKLGVAIIMGSHAETIRLAPVVWALNAMGVDPTIINTTNHLYDTGMNIHGDIFDLRKELPTDPYHKSMVTEVASMIFQIENTFRHHNQSVVFTAGGSNAAMAAALVAKESHMSLVRLNAGSRGFYRHGNQATNNIMIDHTSNILFPSTKNAFKNLSKEGLTEHALIFQEGSTTVDVIKHCEDLYQGSPEVDAIKEYETRHGSNDFTESKYNLVVLSGVTEYGDEVLGFCPPKKKILNALRGMGKPIIISDKHYSQVNERHLRTIPPQEYLRFFFWEKNADLIITDSPWVQEEACILNVPCITLSNDTERPETIDIGANTLVDPVKDDLGKRWLQQACAGRQRWTHPYGSGTTGEAIVEIVYDLLGNYPRISSMEIHSGADLGDIF